MIDVEKLREKRLAYQRKYVAKAKPAYAAFIKHFPLDPTSLADEIWADIEGYEGEYQISTYSRVKSFKWGFPKILKPELCGVYLAVHLLLDGKPQHFSVHVLAARAFIPNPDNKPEVNHIDGVKLNCHISNLEWVTQSENVKHAFRIGFKKSKHGVENTLAKLTENQVREIFKIFVPYSHKYGIQALARKYGVAINTIRKIVHGKSYKNIPRSVDKFVEKAYINAGGAKMNLNLGLEKDKPVYDAIAAELKRQRDGLEMIASENIVSKAVMEAQGSIFTLKYAEGTVGRRFYGGCVNVDIIEQLAIDRACELFGAKFANVQPHSGAQANMAVFMALLNVGDTVMSMNLTDGGHLSHGSPVNFSGKYFKIIPYGVSAETEMLDYDALEKLAVESQPKLIIAGASAYSRILDFERFAAIAKKVGAYLLVDMAHIAGLVAGGVHPSPIPYADVVTSTTHKSLRGPRGGFILWNDENLTKKINSAVFPGTQGGPLMHVIAAKAVAFGEALEPEFKDYAAQIVKNAKTLADKLAADGFRIVSGGTDNHLMLVDLTSKNLTGKVAQALLEDVNITINKNTIPFEKLSPFVTSGVRIGTPAVTTRGLVEEDMAEVADIITLVLNNPEDDAKKSEARDRVAALCKKYPLY